MRSVTPLGSIELVPGDVGWWRTRDPNVSTPGYTRIGVVSYLAKVSEDSGARPTSVVWRVWRHVTRSVVRVRREESEVELAHEPQGCLARTASRRG